MRSSAPRSPHLASMLRPLSADAFGMLLWEQAPGRVDEVIRMLIAKRQRPPVTPKEMAAALGLTFPSVASVWLDARAF